MKTPRTPDQGPDAVGSADVVTLHGKEYTVTDFDWQDTHPQTFRLPITIPAGANPPSVGARFTRQGIEWEITEVVLLRVGKHHRPVDRGAIVLAKKVHHP